MSTNSLSRLAVAGLLAVSLAGCQAPESGSQPPAPVGQAAAPAPVAGTPTQAFTEADLKSTTPSRTYPLKDCVVSHESLTNVRLAYLYKGQEVQFCCDHCVADFKADPEKYMAVVRAAKK